jgi:hypothetical protein
MATPIIQSSFSSGEVSPSLYGRLDLAGWHKACSVARNFFVSYKGGLLSRGGLAFVGFCKQAASASSYPPRNIQFTFNIFQSYILEFGEQYMRVVANGGYVTEAAFVITGASQANPCVLTIPGHNYVVGDWIFLIGLGGMTQLNARTVVVRNVAGNNVTIQDVFGTPVNSTAYGAFTAGGTAARIYTLVTPYHAADLPYLKFVQSADTMSLTLVNQATQTEYPPQELARLAANNWTIGQPSFASAIAAPGSCTVVGTAYSTGPGPAAYGYVVTAIDSATGDESQPSTIGVVGTVVDIAGQFGTNTVSWPSVPGASEYKIYRAAPDYTNVGNFAGQLFGYVGSSRTTSWQDTNIIADFATTPPLHTNPFAAGQILDIPMTNIGANYTAATASITINSATGKGFVGVPIIGAALTGQQITFASNPFSNGETVTQQIGTATAQGLVVASNSTTINVQLFGSTQFIQSAGSGGGSPGGPVTDGTNSEYPTNVASITFTGSGGWIGTYIENPGQGYLPTDLPVFADSGSGAGATGTLSVGPQSGTFPGVAAYFQQRRTYAYSLTAPDTYEMSQPGSYLNFDSADPPIDSDSITGTPWGEQIDGIQWMRPMPGGLVTFTGGTTWQVSGTAGAGSPITPSQQNAQAQEGIGSSPTIAPIRIRNNLLYVDSLNGFVNEINYNFYFNIYTGQDITLLSSQLFQNTNLVQWALAFSPYRLIWAVRNDGKMLSLTYIAEQEMRGWARHDTCGLVASVAVASEPPVNAAYFIVKRYVTGRGQWMYMQERMDNRLWQNVEQSYCLDSALSLPQPAPNANLVASAAHGAGGVQLGAIILGGSGYSATPAGQIVDDAGTGSGAMVTGFTVVAGVITGLTITPGVNYKLPRIIVTDATGSGVNISLVVDNTVTFTADGAVFSSGNNGAVLRVGGGIGTSVLYVSPTLITAQVAPQAAIATTIANDPNNMPVPAVAGSWTLTQPVSSISGLEHLEGMTVNALCDGTPVVGLVVVNGSVTLPNPASQVLIGLPFIAQAQSMHADMPGETIQGKRKRIQGVTVRMANTRGIMIGQDQPIAAQQQNQIEIPWNQAPNLMTQLTEANALAGAGNAVPLFSGDRYEVIAGDYSTATPDRQASPGMVAVQQLLPLPAEILAFIPELELGDVPNA